MVTLRRAPAERLRAAEMEISEGEAFQQRDFSDRAGAAGISMGPGQSPG